MKQRCTNPKAIGYENYGGRGITVCDRWKDSFENFLADMGERPPKMEIERKDNNGPYSPENCRWATHREQAINRRTNRLLTIDGETLCITDWGARSGVRPHVISRRIKKGVPVKEAVFTPAQKRTKRYPEPQNALAKI